MPDFTKLGKTQLGTKDLSELLVLDVIQRLGRVRVSQLVYALKQATKNSRAPFFIGSPLRDVLSTYKNLHQIESTSDGSDDFYSLTPGGKRALNRWGDLILKYYPGVQEVARGSFNSGPDQA